MSDLIMLATGYSKKYPSGEAHLFQTEWLEIEGIKQSVRKEPSYCGLTAAEISENYTRPYVEIREGEPAPSRICITCQRGWMEDETSSYGAWLRGAPRDGSTKVDDLPLWKKG